MLLTNQDSDQVAATIKQFEDFFEIYQSILPYLTIDESKKAFIEKKEDWISRLNNQEFPVAFLGAFTAGKSTIINGILGREVLPEATKATTAFPTIIKKGNSEEALVSYIDEDTKKQLWSQFCLEIANKIGQKNLEQQPQEKLKPHLDRIEAAITEYEQMSSLKIDRTPLEKLKILLTGWHQEKYKKIKKISLSELKQYVEGHEDSLYIDRIEVFLENIDIPDDIVLVDLPGLAVANERHVEFTKQYIREKAKAFVVCMKPKSLLEGEEITFLDETSRSNPTILQRSFWVINQWDILNEQHRKEEQNNFAQKVKDRNFSINNNRFFKVSALNYLLLTCLTRGTIKEMEKWRDKDKLFDQFKRSRLVDDVDDNDNISPEQAKKLLKHPEVASFSEFCAALFNYLNKEAKEEFIADAKQEILRAIRILDALARPLYEQYSQSTNLEEEIRAVAIDNQLNLFIEKLKGKVKQFAQEVRLSKNNQFWRESETNKIIAEIDKRIIKINRDELENNLKSGPDVPEGLISRLPAIIEPKIKLTSLMREKLVAVIDSFFIQRLGKLLTELETVNKDYFPEEVIKHLEDKLCERDISMRLRGLADALFYKYGDKLEEIGLSLYQCNAETFPDFSERLEQALRMYKDGLDKLIEELAETLNSRVSWSIKNHTEDLEEELLELFDTCRDSLTSQIARNINLSDTVAEEMKKQTVINNGYTKLINLKSLIMESLGSTINKNSSVALE